MLSKVFVLQPKEKVSVCILKRSHIKIFKHVYRKLNKQKLNSFIKRKTPSGEVLGELFLYHMKKILMSMFKKYLKINSISHSNCITNGYNLSLLQRK